MTGEVVHRGAMGLLTSLVAPGIVLAGRRFVAVATGARATGARAATGLFFDPSSGKVVYRGSFTDPDGVEMSRAFAGTLDSSFDVRAGWLVRQMHHWAATVFVAAILIHLLRIMPGIMMSVPPVREPGIRVSRPVWWRPR